MADPDGAVSDTSDVSSSGSQGIWAQTHTDPRDITSLRFLAQRCERHLQGFLRDEEAKADGAGPRDSHWASRQYAEFNVWCAKVGVYGEGHRSIDVRLKDVPSICNLLRQLLQTLARDLGELEQITRRRTSDAGADGDGGRASDGEDPESDDSSLSFGALSSAEASEAGSTADGQAAPWMREALALQTHVEDTIDRLHGHALRIDNASARHRQRRAELYRQKSRTKLAHEAYRTIALYRARAQFKDARPDFLERLAESFARRRLRLDYLAEHEKKLAVRVLPPPEQRPSPWPAAQAEAEAPQALGATTGPAAQGSRDSGPAAHPLSPSTVLSGTVQTTLEAHLQRKPPQRAESVASVALRNPGFPPPPACDQNGFRCPFCRIGFRPREAEKDRWGNHVMQDLEPYFCVWGDCETPFDVPNSFEGLLSHMQSHVDVSYHVDTPDGAHYKFDEAGFEAYVAGQGAVAADMVATMKESSRRRAAFLFDSCPFCGGFPDDVERRFPDRGSLECQRDLRRHIKQHMQDVALVLLPARDDISDDGENLESLAAGGPQDPTDNAFDVSDLGDFPYDPGEVMVPPELWDTTASQELSTFLACDASPADDAYYLGDTTLRPFVARAQRLAAFEVDVFGGPHGLSVPTAPGSMAFSKSDRGLYNGLQNSLSGTSDLNDSDEVPALPFPPIDRTQGRDTTNRSAVNATADRSAAKDTIYRSALADTADRSAVKRFMDRLPRSLRPKQKPNITAAPAADSLLHTLPHYGIPNISPHEFFGAMEEGTSDRPASSPSTRGKSPPRLPEPDLSFRETPKRYTTSERGADFHDPSTHVEGPSSPLVELPSHRLEEPENPSPGSAPSSSKNKSEISPRESLGASEGGTSDRAVFRDTVTRAGSPPCPPGEPSRQTFSLPGLDVMLDVHLHAVDLVPYNFMEVAGSVSEMTDPVFGGPSLKQPPFAEVSRLVYAVTVVATNNQSTRQHLKVRFEFPATELAVKKVVEGRIRQNKTATELHLAIERQVNVPATGSTWSLQWPALPSLQSFTFRVGFLLRWKVRRRDFDCAIKVSLTPEGNAWQRLANSKTISSKITHRREGLRPKISLFDLELIAEIERLVEW